MRAVRWLAVLPFPAMLVGPFFLNRVSPPVLGMPFLLAWLVAAVSRIHAQSWRSYFGSIRRTGTVRHERRSRGHRSGGRARAQSGLFGSARQADEPRAVDRGRPGIRRAIGVSPDGAGNLHDLHLFGGQRGFAYGKGGPAYYILCYGSLAYVISYFMLVCRQAGGCRRDGNEPRRAIPHPLELLGGRGGY